MRRPPFVVLFLKKHVVSFDWSNSGDFLLAEFHYLVCILFLSRGLPSIYSRINGNQFNQLPHPAQWKRNTAPVKFCLFQCNVSRRNACICLY